MSILQSSEFNFDQLRTRNDLSILEASSILIDFSKGILEADNRSIAGVRLNTIHRPKSITYQITENICILPSFYRIYSDDKFIMWGVNKLLIVKIPVYMARNKYSGFEYSRRNGLLIECPHSGDWLQVEVN